MSRAKSQVTDTGAGAAGRGTIAATALTTAAATGDHHRHTPIVTPAKRPLAYVLDRIAENEQSCCLVVASWPARLVPGRNRQKSISACGNSDAEAHHCKRSHVPERWSC
jgi:hypothetical protein